jgi:hypothetical protein
MAHQTKLSAAGLYQDGLLAQMPPWFKRKGCEFTESPGTVYLTFAAPCSCGRDKQSVYVGKAKGTDKAKKLADGVITHHAMCQEQTTALDPEQVLAVAREEIVRLEKALNKQRGSASQFCGRDPEELRLHGTL